jgi:hypothetical protein
MGTPFRGVTPVPFPFNLAVSLPPVLGRPVKKEQKKKKKRTESKRAKNFVMMKNTINGFTRMNHKQFENHNPQLKKHEKNQTWNFRIP